LLPVPSTIRNKKLIGLILISSAATALAALLIFSGLLTNLENRTWDLRAPFIAQHTVPDPKIMIVMIDQSSLEVLAEQEKQFWPWPRELYVPIIEYLRTGGAKGIGIDIIFSEQSSYGVSDDEALARSLGGEMPVAMAIALRSSGKPLSAERLELIRALQLSKKDSNLQNLRLTQDYSSATAPVLEILKATKLIGNVSSPNDSDGVFRHIIPGGLLNGIPVLTLPFALADALPQARLADLPYMQDSTLAVRFAGPARTYRTYPFSAVLSSFQQQLEGKQPQIPASEFKDAYVFIGMDAPGLLDLRPTPLSPNFPGVEYHANVLDNLIHNSFIRPASIWENLLFIFISAFLIVAAALYVRETIYLITIFTLIFFGIAVLACFFGVYGVWIQLAATFCAAISALVAALVFQYQTEGSNFRFIKHAFKYYVSHEIIERILENPSSLQLGGERKELTVFFSDIAGFTSISESIEPTKLVQLLNLFLTEMTEIILQHGGTVDKYVGDAIIAFWNAPVETANHALKAVSAAIDCQKRILAMTHDFEKFGASLALRIGINTGNVNVGNFGSKQRFNYTFIGDSANVASRIEGVNKIFGTKILFTEQTCNAIKEAIPCLEVGTVKVIGRDEAVTVFTPQELFPNLDGKLWSGVLQAFKAKNFSMAADLLANIPENALTKAYLQRMQKGDVMSPVWEMKDK
jgi:adenylate cyclase